MSLHKYAQDHEACLAAARELLGAPVRAVELSHAVEQLVRPHLRHETRRGVLVDHAVLSLDAGRGRHKLLLGTERFRVDVDPPLHVAHVRLPYDDYDASGFYQFWAVREAELRRFHRWLRTLERKQHEAQPPVMAAGDRARLWANTVEFLRRDCRELRRFGVPARRGVLLLGQPGNGKTMACRWLRDACQRRGLAWQSVTAEQLRQATHHAEAHQMFQLERPGIVFFDDVDAALRRRDTFHPCGDESTFLAGLDGLDQHHGVVYVFTSNAELDDLDPAFRRPGRMDLILHFPRPDEELRREFLTTRWPPELVQHLDLEHVVAQSEQLSFAELEELKKLLVLNYLASQVWDWPRAWREFQAGRGSVRRSVIGFRDRLSLASSCFGCESGRQPS